MAAASKKSKKAISLFKPWCYSVAWAGVGAVVLGISWVFARTRTVSSLETSLFWKFFNWPAAFWPFFYLSSMLGLFVLCGLAMIWLWRQKRYYQSFWLLATVFIAFATSLLVKVMVRRGRPGEFFASSNFKDYHDVSFGFPSSHVAVAAATAAVLMYYIPKRFRMYLWLFVVMVMISRIYLGAHLPLDVVGGLGIGLLVGHLMMLLDSYVPAVTKRDLEKVQN